MRVSFEDFLLAVEFVHYNKPSLKAAKVNGLTSPCQQCTLRGGTAVYMVCDDLAVQLSLTSLDKPLVEHVTKLPLHDSESHKREAKKKWLNEVRRQEKNLADLSAMFEEDL